MDFGLTDEQQLLVESLKEYADRYFDDESVRQMYENHQVSAEAQDAYRDAGFPFMGLPEEVGGIPTDHVTLGLMTEKLYEFTGAMNSPLSSWKNMKSLVSLLQHSAFPSQLLVLTTRA